MKKTFLPVLLFIAVCFGIASCSNGEYSANPGGNANGSINPLKPLTSGEFTWGGTGKFSVKVNGSFVSTDSAYWHLDTTGANEINAFTKDGKWIRLHLKDTYGGNLYNMGFKQYNTYCQYLIGIDTTNFTYTFCESPKGNSGGLFMNRNDSALIEGRFYCQTVSATGVITNLTEGYFKLDKF